MSEDQKTNGQSEELSFDIKITNGAAKLLQKIKQKLAEDSAKDVVALGLQILDYALTDDADLIVKKKNGEDVKIILRKKT